MLTIFVYCIHSFLFLYNVLKCNYKEKGDEKMEFIMILFVFFLLMIISSTLNILFKMTERKHWVISLLLSIVLSITIVAILGVT